MFDTYTAFYDELEKISAQKCRSGSTPIRAHNLASKSKYDGSDKVRTKLSGIQLANDVAQQAKFLTPGKLKSLGLLGGGALGALTLEQAYKDWSLGRDIRKQQQ